MSSLSPEQRHESRKDIAAPRPSAPSLHIAAMQAADSAQGLSTAASSPGAAAAIPASLAPLTAALEELERTAREIENIARERLFTAASLLGGRWSHEHSARTVREFEELTRALQVAVLASATARDFAGPIVAELTST
jgi:hypothetical protein